MRTRDLVKMLRARFGNVVAVGIWFFRMAEHRDGTVELEGVLEALAGNKLVCGGTVVRAKCDFMNAIYSVSTNAVVHAAVTHKPVIYTRYRQGNVTLFLYVPCIIDNVDVSKFEVVAEAGRECPFRGTDMCPLYRACGCK
jgi:glyoxylate carboligase